MPRKPPCVEYLHLFLLGVEGNLRQRQIVPSSGPESKSGQTSDPEHVLLLGTVNDNKY